MTVFCDRKHSLLALSLEYFFGCVPDENGALSSNRHNELLVWCNCNLGDSSTVASATELGEPFVVAPKLHNLVLTAAHEVFAFSGDGESVNFAGG